MENPLLGILIYVLGGAAGASFYLPFKAVKKWNWETYWLVYSIAGLFIIPWAMAFWKSPNVVAVLRATDLSTLAICCLFGAMWGIGNISWGLMIRYLGVGLGLAIGCGVCASVGTILPSLVTGEIAATWQKAGGAASVIATLAGVVVGLLGIVVTGAAGMSKERELSDEQKKAAVAEFNFPKGLVIAIFSGVMSAGMNFGVQYGKSIAAAAETIAPVTPKLWAGLPCLVAILMGGFLINAGWCVLLNAKNKAGGNFSAAGSAIPLNIILCVLAGALWYSQMAGFTMGDSQMGKNVFAGWSVFMSATIFFSTLWGVILKEWKGSSARTRNLLTAGLLILVLSLVIIGYGKKIAPADAPAPAADAKPAAASTTP